MPTTMATETSPVSNLSQVFRPLFLEKVLSPLAGEASEPLGESGECREMLT